MKRQVILCGVHHLLIWSILFSSCTLFSSFTWLTAPPWSVGWKGIQNISKHLLETKFVEFWRWMMLSLFDYSPINPNFTWTDRRLYSALWTPVIWVCGWCMHACKMTPLGHHDQSPNLPRFQNWTPKSQASLSCTPVLVCLSWDNNEWSIASKWSLSSNGINLSICPEEPKDKLH